jgi:hypothetical protein
MVELFNYDRHLQAHEDRERQSARNNMHPQHDYSRSLSIDHRPSHSPPKPHPSADLIKHQDEEFEKSEIEDLIRLHHRQEGSAPPHLPDHAPAYDPLKQKAMTSLLTDVIDVYDGEEEEDSHSYVSKNKVNTTSSPSASTSTVTPRRIATGPRISLAFRFKFFSSSAAGGAARPSKVVESFHIDSLLQV